MASHNTKGASIMKFQDYFPIWNKLSEDEQKLLLDSLLCRTAKKGTVIHNGSNDCTGLFSSDRDSFAPISSRTRDARSRFTAFLNAICACSLPPA